MRIHFTILLITLSGFLLITFLGEHLSASPSKRWQTIVTRVKWVAYSPTNANPKKGIEPSIKEIRKDLALLRKAHFRGLVTYSSAGIVGRKLPALAHALKLYVIVGIWDPFNQEELAAAKAAAKYPNVLGYCIGNEGLGKRYQLKQLAKLIHTFKQLTGKPVTTTEEFDDYYDARLIELGDWIFPNAHPYFHNHLEPQGAVRWTVGAYNELRRKTHRFIWFKEVGLPTAGDKQGRLSERKQAEYYRELSKTKVRFCYFEAFDLPWKDHLPVEPHWGIFKSDRTPKLLALRFLRKEIKTIPSYRSSSRSSSQNQVFYIYRDASSPSFYRPTGYMGDCGDIHIQEAYPEDPYSGDTCIRIIYEAKGKGPHTCSYAPPCQWAGVYWQYPPNNWGKGRYNKGLDLSSYNCLVFWAKSEKEGWVEFKVGGIDGPYGDSLSFPRSKIVKLTTQWTKYEIDLKDADLSHIIGGFCWVSNWERTPGGIQFYLDDIHFEKK